MFLEKDYKKSDLAIIKIPIDDLIEYSDSKFQSVAGRPQPFKEYSKEELTELAKSISECGVLQPISVRPYKNKYQIMAGRNRVNASVIAGKTTIPAIVYPKIDDMQAAIIMLDTNLRQRTNLMYSELAFAYRMKMELLNRHGMRTDLISNSDKIDSLAEVGKSNSQSRRTVANLIRLTYLIPELMDLIDKGKLGLMVGVQLSYLSKEGQILVLENVICKGKKIKKDDVIRLRQIEKEHELSFLDLNAVAKPKSDKFSITISRKKLSKYEEILKNKNIEKLFMEFLENYKGNSVQPLHKAKGA